MRFHHPTAILATVVLICGTVDAVHAQYRRATPRTQPTQILEIEGARHIAPATVDRAVQEHLQDHTVLMPEQPRGTLLLWLAGSGAKVDYYTELMKTGRDLGYHVIGLSYANDPSLIQICARAPERDCFRDARLEKITGNDVSNRTRVSRADSIEERLVRLLDYLDAEYPDEGWDRFANRNDIDWSRIAVAGHSQGGGNAAMIGQMHAVQRVVMFSSPSDHNWSTGALAPWTSDRFATPADRFFGISHTGERNHEQHLAHWEAIGLTRYGGPTRLDERTPPYGGAHVLTTGIAPVVNNYHVAPVGDAELTRMSNGEPVMREAWAYLLGGEDARLPVYVADEGVRAAEPSPSQTTRGDTGSASRYPSRSAGSGGRSGGDASMLFDRFDRNGDGYLSRNEIPSQLTRLRSGFDQIDRNNDGLLAPEEFGGSASRSGGGSPTAGTSRGGRSDRGGGGGAGYIDPEILASYRVMVYQDSLERIWLEELDFSTGMHESSTRDRILMDSDAAPLIETWNGPEFGVDANGWRLYYTKGARGNLQIWEATLENGRPVTRTVLADGDRRQSILVSKNRNADSIRLAYLKGDKTGGDWYWMDVADPSRESRIVTLKGKDSPRWIDDTFTLVFAESRGRDAGQLKLYDTVTGRVSTITDDAGVKSFAYGWYAPDFGGDMLVLAMVDDRRIGVWRDPGDGGMWPRIATIDPPSTSKYPYMGSPEPFLLNGKSYMSLVIKQQSAGKMFSDSEVWVFGLEPEGEVTTRRVDNDGRSQWMRSDPETVVTDDGAFVYYNGYTRSEGYKLFKVRFSTPDQPRSGAEGASRGATDPPPERGPGPKLGGIYPSSEQAWPVDQRELTWQDDVRGRTFRTLAYLPDADIARVPLVLYSPGMGGTHEGNLFLAEHWAAHGYAVLMFDHPGSNIEVFEREGVAGLRKALLDRENVVLRTGDIRHVLDELQSGYASQPFLYGRVDTTRIAMTGHSYGSFTTMALAGMVFEYRGDPRHSLVDPRISAAIAMGPQGREDRYFGIDEHAWDDVRIPVMLMTGTEDAGSSGQDYTWRYDPFNFMPPGDKYIVVIEGAGHNSYYDQPPLIPAGKPRRDPRHFGWIQEISLAFLDATIKADAAARTWLRDGSIARATGGETTIEFK